MGSILVLGGAGYIGSHTVYELIDAGKDVVVVDNLETGFRAAVHPKAKFYEGDIRNRAFIDSVFDKENIDGVIHFAASSQVGESMIKPLKYYSNNLCDGNDSNIFNLGNGVGFTVKEVVETARKVTGHSIPAKEEPRRAGDPSMLIASSAKAREVLGWNPQYADLETIIGTAWKWHKSHPNGYQNV